MTPLLGAHAPNVSQLLAEVALPDEERQRLFHHFVGRARWEGMYAEAKVYRST
ncbi:MAG: hypothetical protein M3220_02610 [Chloroflexota bacterium]|nr:hypothetical protein [Chloroflexota bacterium]